MCIKLHSHLLTLPPLPDLPKLSRRYPAGGFSKNNTLLGAMGDTCEPLNAQYTLSGMGGAGAGAPAPAPAPSTTSSALPAAGAFASTVAVAAMAAAAALLF